MRSQLCYCYRLTDQSLCQSMRYIARIYRRLVGGAFGVWWALFPTDSGGLGGGPLNRRRHAEGEARRFLTLKRLWRH